MKVKKTIRMETLSWNLHEIFPTSNTSVQSCLYPLFQNRRPHFLVFHLFQRMRQPSGQDQQNGKWTYRRLPTHFCSINFKDIPSHISMDSYGVYLSRIFLEFLLKPAYCTMVAEKFQSHGVKIPGKCIYESKN